MNKCSNGNAEMTATGSRRSKPQAAAAQLRGFPGTTVNPGWHTRGGTSSVLYVECIEAGALQDSFRGLGAPRIVEWPDLHAVEFVLLRCLHVSRKMFFLQAAGQRQRVILLRQRRHLQDNCAIRNQRRSRRSCNRRMWRG